MLKIVQNEENREKIPFEEALDKTGFGLYSFQMIALTGLVIIASSFVLYGSTIIVPTSACELQTTPPQNGILMAAPIIGSIIGVVIWGYLGDVYGRRPMLQLSLGLGIVVYATASLSVNWIMLLVLQWIASLMAAGQYGLSMTMLSECVPLAKRNLALLLVASIFLLSQGLMAVLAIPIIPLKFSYSLETLGIQWNSWRTMILVYCIPSILSLLWYNWVVESPKFVLVKGKEEEALEILRIYHRVNNGKGASYDVQGILPEATLPQKTSTENKLVPLFKMPLLKFTLIFSTLYILQQVGAFVVWLPKMSDQFVRLLQTGDGMNMTLCGMIHAGLRTPPDLNVAPCALNVTSLLFVLGVACLQSIANVIMSIFINRVGRRNTAIFITSVCGVCGVAVNLVPQAIASVILFAVFLLGLLVIGLYSAIAVTAYPTHLRATALSFAVGVGRLSVFASIQILNTMLENYCETGFYMFAALFASSALILSFLADDRLQTEKQNKHNMPVLIEKAEEVST